MRLAPNAKMNTAEPAAKRLGHGLTRTVSGIPEFLERLKVTVKPVEVNSDRALYGSKYPFPFGESIAKTDVNGKSKLVYEQPDSLSTGNLS